MIGRTISHYKILEKLGEGGMGVVYKAQDTKLDRTVALKFLSPQIVGGEEDKARFVHEAKAAAALSHPNICTVYEINETEDQTFIAFEYVEGQSLKDRIQAGPFKPDEAIDITAQIAEGLQEAHEKGIVHRDIKPANIMITPKGQAKIMDFGLAKSRAAPGLTKTGTTLGTVAFMSPEQARGDDVDHRTDLWSLGAVLYEMATGQLPFKGDYEQAVVYSILNEQPELLSGLRSGVPLDLERIVNKCLEKNAGERYQTAADLIADFRHLRRVSASAITPPPPATHSPARRARQWPWGVGVIAMAALAIWIIPRYVSPPERESSVERKMIAVLPFENLGNPEDAYFADGITEEVTSRLAALQGLGVISRTSAIKYKNTEKTLKEIGEELNVDYALEGTVRWERVGDTQRVRITPQLIQVRDDTHVWANSYERPLESVFAVQADIAEKVAEALNVALLEPERRSLEAIPTANLDAYHAYLRGLEHLRDPDYSRERIDLRLQMFRRAVELDPGFALAHAQRSIAHSALYHWGYDRTPRRLEQARAAAERAVELEPDLPEAHRALGLYHYWGRRDYAQALEEFETAARRLPNDARLLADIAYIWRRQGRFEDAIRNLRRAIELDPKNPKLLTQLAITYTGIRSYADAIRYCDRSISLAPDQEHAYLVKAMCYWCSDGGIVHARAVMEAMPDRNSPSWFWCWYVQEMFERDYGAALEHLAAFPGDLIELQHAYAPKSLLEGLVYDLMNKPEQARPAYESARIDLERAVQELPGDSRVHSSLGQTYAGLERKEEAVREGKLSVELLPVSQDALAGPRRFLDLAFIYTKVGEYDAAVDQLERLLAIPFWVSAEFIHRYPLFDPLRDQPRYRRMMNTYSEESS